MGNQTDIELIQETLNGMTDAFGEIIKRYQNSVYAAALHRVKNFANAQDIAQEAFIEAYKNLRKLSEPEKFPSWLYTITIRQCNRFQRKYRKTLPIDDSEEAKIYSNGSPDPEEELEQKELQNIVLKAISSLPEKTGEIVTMHYIDGLSYDEIAGFLSTPVSTVKGRLQMGRKQLKEGLIFMIDNTLKADRPDEKFAERVLKTIKDAEEAQSKYRFHKAIQYCDDAIKTLDSISESVEGRNMKRDALWLKSSSFSQHISREQALKYAEEALEVERKIGDKPKLARGLAEAARCNSNVGNISKAMEYYQQALDIFTEIGDKESQGQALCFLGSTSLASYKVEEAKSYHRRALDVFGHINKNDSIQVSCHAASNLLKQFGNEIGKIPSSESMFFLGAACDKFGKSSNALVYMGCSGWLADGVGTITDELKRTFNASPFRFLNGSIKLLSFPASVGDNWSLDIPSGGLEPMKLNINVDSISEKASVPAGEFADCLKVNMVTDEEPENCEENRCGKREFIYAPGVGLVKSTLIRLDGAVAISQLTDYDVSESTKDYFPLSIGNRWSYEWADEKGIFPSTDVLEVMASSDNGYFVSHYYYAVKRD